MPDTLTDLSEHLHEQDLKILRLDGKHDASIIKLNTTLDNINVTVQKLNDTIDVVRDEARSLITEVALLKKTSTLHGRAIKRLLHQNKAIILTDRQQRWRFNSLVYMSVVGMIVMLFAYAVENRFFEWVVKMFK
jgi:hypothetical protein